jgi:hypothetical protein
MDLGGASPNARLVIARRSDRDISDAEAWFVNAISIAKQQSAKFWELRAATSFARPWHTQGRNSEAATFLRRSIAGGEKKLAT